MMMEKRLQRGQNSWIEDRTHSHVAKLATLPKFIGDRKVYLNGQSFANKTNNLPINLQYIASCVGQQRQKFCPKNGCDECEFIWLNVTTFDL